MGTRLALPLVDLRLVLAHGHMPSVLPHCTLGSGFARVGGGSQITFRLILIHFSGGHKKVWSARGFLDAKVGGEDPKVIEHSKPA